MNKIDMPFNENGIAGSLDPEKKWDIFQGLRKASWREKVRWGFPKKETVYTVKKGIHTVIVPNLCGSNLIKLVVPDSICLHDKVHHHHCYIYKLMPNGAVYEVKRY